MSDEAAAVRMTPRVASWFCAAGVRYATAQTRNGQRVPPDFIAALQDMAAASDAELNPVGSGSRTAVGTVSYDTTGMVSIAVAADLTGRSRSYLQRLAREGRVRRERVGRRTWLVDLESVQNVLRRTT